MSPSLIAQIHAWLTHEDYTEGLRLFRDRYGETIRYRTLLIGDNPHNRQRLRELLCEELPALESPARKREEQDDEEKVPEQIAIWRNTTYALMDERLLLKQLLRDRDDHEQEERREAAFRILEITETLDTLFGKLRYFDQYKRVPEEEVIPVETPQLPQTYLNLRSYISKATRRLHEGCNCQTCMKLKGKIESWYLKMKEIETELRG
jgi:hypothetical protein